MALASNAPMKRRLVNHISHTVIFIHIYDVYAVDTLLHGQVLFVSGLSRKQFAAPQAAHSSPHTYEPRSGKHMNGLRASLSTDAIAFLPTFCIGPVLYAQSFDSADLNKAQNARVLSVPQK